MFSKDTGGSMGKRQFRLAKTLFNRKGEIPIEAARRKLIEVKTDGANRLLVAVDGRQISQVKVSIDNGGEFSQGKVGHQA